MKFPLEENVADPAARDALTWKPLRLLSFYRLSLAGLLTALFYGIADIPVMLAIMPMSIYLSRFYTMYIEGLQIR